MKWKYPRRNSSESARLHPKGFSDEVQGYFFFFYQHTGGGSKTVQRGEREKEKSGSEDLAESASVLPNMVWNAETPQTCDVKRQSDLEGGGSEGGYSPWTVFSFETLNSTSSCSSLSERMLHVYDCRTSQNIASEIRAFGCLWSVLSFRVKGGIKQDGNVKQWS